MPAIAKSQTVLLLLTLTALLAVRAQPAGAAPAPGAYATLPAIAGAAFPGMIDLALLDSTQAVVVTQPGLLYRVSLTGAFAPQPWGDLRDRVRYGGEEGLLSIALSPAFASDGRVYLYYTAGSPLPSRLSRFQASTAGGLDPDTEEVLLEVPQPYGNHNGGRVLFGPDGYLYLSTGDGGGFGDPTEASQDLTKLLGKVLRLDAGGLPAAGNPFNDGAGPLREEVWAYGFRNPWRYSFDPVTGVLWMGDVGQGSWEEVEPVVAGGNYGWDCYEGFAVYEAAGCPPSGFQFPRAVYGHDGGNCSVTGGYVYRGAAMPELQGWYVFGDYCSGRIWAVDAYASGDPVLLTDTPFAISSFAELPGGELLIITFNNAIYRLASDADKDGMADEAEDTDGDSGVPPAYTQCAGPCPGGYFNDAAELFTGTDRTSRCASTAAPDDEGLDAWPVDVDDNRTADLVDVLRFIPVFGAAAPGPPYDRRFDFDMSGRVGMSDVLRFIPYFGATCTP